MVTHISLLFSQLIVGFAAGFYFTDQKKGVSYKEVRIGVILLLAITSFLLYQSPQMDMMFIGLLLISAVVLFGSILIGERVHLKLLEGILKGIEKECILTNIDRFLQEANHVACSSDSCRKEFMDVELYKTVNYLKEAAKQVSMLRQKELANQIEYLAESCATLARLSTSIQTNEDKDYHKFQQLSQQLQVLSQDTLSHTEKRIEKDLNKSWNIIAFAVKTVHMK